MIESAAPLDLGRYGLWLAIALTAIALQPPYAFLVVRAIRRGLSRTAPARTRAAVPWAIGAACGLLAAAVGLGPAGPAPVLIALAIVCWMLALLDVRYLWLPDRITLPLLLLGLAAAWPDPDLLLDAAIGAVAGGAAFYAVHRGFRAIRGYDGLGLGDVKLLAALGAWVGAPPLAWLVLLACLTALALVAAGSLRRQGIEVGRIPFGAHLALAGWVMVCLRQSPFGTF